MMKKTVLALAALSALSLPAQALKLTLWDRDLQTKVAYGESVGGKFNVKFDKDYEGPVIALFSQTDDERARGSFGGLQSSYTGRLQDGQIVLEVASKSVPLARLLQTFKLPVTLQPSGRPQ